MRISTQNRLLLAMASVCPVAEEKEREKKGTGGCPVQHGQREEQLGHDVNPYNLVKK